MLVRARIPIVALAGLALLLGGCVPEPAPAPAPTTTAASPSPTPHVVESLSPAERVGQLFMVGTDVDGVDPLTVSAVVDRHAGGVFLHGRSSAGVEATAAFVAQFTALAAGEVPLWIATDQEGGDVQVLSGPGFDEIPYAVEQGGLPTDELRERAAVWGAQLAAAGVTVNLAPVADIVTSPDVAEQNAPIGALLRNYGYDAATVAAQAGAFADGMRRAGVMPTFKHFPGLGRTTENTDDAAGVVDAVIDARSPDVEVYRDLLAGGPAIVMVSLATYQGIDPAAPAVFSPIVVDDLLRDAIGHEGVVMTDDLSATASVAGVPPADRALRAIEAGVDVVLVSADPAVFAEMYDAVLARAESDPAFAAVVDAAARRVVDAKLAGP